MRACITDLAAYNEGKLIYQWLDLDDFTDADDLGEAITALLAEWTEKATQDITAEIHAEPMDSKRRAYLLRSFTDGPHRDHVCNCGHKWRAPISTTTTGETPAHCPKCGAVPLHSSAHVFPIAYPREEYAVHDWECPQGVDFGEYPDWDDVFEMKEALEETDAAIIEAGIALDIPLDKITDAYRGRYESRQAFAMEEVEYFWESLPEIGQLYFDWDKYTYSLFINDYQEHYSDGEHFVFSCNW